MKRNPTFKNQLSLIRKRSMIQQKQVAKLLGHKSVEYISRFERGTKLPSLRTALKLAIIYKVPIRAMLDGYFEVCRNEVRKQEEAMGAGTKRAAIGNSIGTEYCSLEEKLMADRVIGSDLEEAHRHSVRLVRRRAEKLNHLSVRSDDNE